MWHVSVVRMQEIITHSFLIVLYTASRTGQAPAAERDPAGAGHPGGGGHRVGDTTRWRVGPDPAQRRLQLEGARR